MRTYGSDLYGRAIPSASYGSEEKVETKSPGGGFSTWGDIVLCFCRRRCSVCELDVSGVERAAGLISSLSSITLAKRSYEEATKLLQGEFAAKTGLHNSITSELDNLATKLKTVEAYRDDLGIQLVDMQVAETA